MVERIEPAMATSEAATLHQFLDYYRATLLLKIDGLDAQQARREACSPSTLNLLGLVRHMADVERHWFRRVLADQDAPPIFYTADNDEGDMQPDTAATVREAVGALEAEIGAAQTLTAGLALDHLCAQQRHGATVNLRWVMVHMIEEYARHCGHADLLREAIDGTVGD